MDRDGVGRGGKVVLVEWGDEVYGFGMTDEDGAFSMPMSDDGDMTAEEVTLVIRDPARGGDVVETIPLAEADGAERDGEHVVRVVLEATDPVSHGTVEHRGLSPDALAGDRADEGRFVRSLELPPHRPGEAFLRALGAEDGPMHEAADDPGGDTSVPAGFPIFAQFIDHEITLDLTSSLERRVDPNGLENFRTPRLDLDSLYGDGEEGSPFLYDQRREGKLLLADPDPDVLRETGVPTGPYDLQRNRQGRALSVDPRNDENQILSQMLVAFVRFHNHVVDYITSGPGADDEYDLVDDEDGDATAAEEMDVLERARRLVRYHYQWAIRHDFLPAVCDRSVLEDVEQHGRQYFLTGETPAIPIEFAVAAYRYGHSRIRNRYELNDRSGVLRLFPDMHPGTDGDGVAMDDNLRGFDYASPDRAVDWERFFEYGDAPTQRARAVDPFLSDSLFTLPFINRDGVTSLATRNLLRGRALGLPSGQALAEAMGYEPIPNDALPTADGTFAELLREHGRGAETEAPAWYYILAEAQVQADGERLGAVGSRIVAEVFHGLLHLDETSVVTAAPDDWTPVLPGAEGTGEGYGLADIFAFASRPAPDGLTIADVEPTGTERVTLAQTGNGTVDIGDYSVEFGDGERARIGNATDERSVTLAPGERLDVYPGEGTGSASEVYLGVRGGRPVLADAGDTVTVRTGTGELSDTVTYGD